MKFKIDGKSVTVLRIPDNVSIPKLNELKGSPSMPHDDIDDLFDDTPSVPKSVTVTQDARVTPEKTDDLDFLFSNAPLSTAPQSAESLQPHETKPASQTETKQIQKISIDSLFQAHLSRKSSVKEFDACKAQQNEEILFFSQIDVNNPEDREKVALRLSQLSDIATETRNRFAKLSQLARESDAKNNVTVWDRERRGTNALNGSLRLTDPRTAKDKEQEKEIRKHKKNLSKAEQIVSDMLDLGDTPDEVLASLLTSKKFSEEQAKGMLKRVLEAKGE